MASLVSSVCWVRRGIAKETPDRVELDADALEEILAARGPQNLDKYMNGNDEEELPRKSPRAVAKHEDEGAAPPVEEAGRDPDDDSEADEQTEEEKQPVDPDDPYDLEHYDDDDDKTDDPLNVHISNIAVYANNKEDPYITIPDDVDSDDEMEDFKIKQTDNLILAGRAAPECSILEIYVYNSEEGSLYCHHDIVLPAFPLATQWLNYDPDTKQPGNLVAVGSMEAQISLWDIDLVDSIEPVCLLGEKPSSQNTSKRKKKKKGSADLSGHTDAVLDLSWHSLAPTALASASADFTAGVWDLSTSSQVLSLKHEEKVQSIEFHPQESSVLLTGAFDTLVRLFDCRQSNQKSLNWKLNGEVERVLWDQFSPFNFYASTDTGHVFYMDSRKEKTPVFTLSAHESSVTGLTQCSQYKGSLVTIAMDSYVKIWDTSDNKASCVYSKKFKDKGGLTCVSSSPDSSSILVIGSEKCVTVWNANERSSVSKHFDGKTSSSQLNSDESLDTEMKSMTLTSPLEDEDDELQDFLQHTDLQAPKQKTDKENKQLTKREIKKAKRKFKRQQTKANNS